MIHEVDLQYSALSQPILHDKNDVSDNYDKQSERGACAQETLHDTLGPF